MFHRQLLVIALLIAAVSAFKVGMPFRIFNSLLMTRLMRNQRLIVVPILVPFPNGMVSALLNQRMGLLRSLFPQLNNPQIIIEAPGNTMTGTAAATITVT